MTDEVRIERLIHAAPDVVFDAFTSVAGQEAFYDRDDAGWLVESRCELRVGGVWSVSFGARRNDLYRHRHVFEVIDRPRRILLATREIRPDGSRLDFTTEFTFDEHGGDTLMSMVQTGLPSPELRAEHARGVPVAFDNLETLILRTTSRS